MSYSRKLLASALSLLLCLALASPAQAAIALVNHNFAQSPTGSSATTTATNCTGADLEIVYISVFSGATGTAVTDSSSNTWNPLTLGTQARIYYAWNPTVSSTQTFTASATNFFGTIYAECFSGSQTSSDPFDVENHGTASGGNTVQPGSVTPSQANSLIVTGLSSFTNSLTATINSSFTVTDASANAGNVSGGMAYLIQSGGPTAVNPTWSNFNGTTYGAVIAVFKPAAGAPSTPPTSYTVLGITP